MLSKPKLRNYAYLKSERGLAKHLECQLSKRERSLTQKLRLGTLPIAVEVGRYSNLPLKERTCKLCMRDDVEDEYHLLFVCDKYHELRNAWVNKMNYGGLPPKWNNYS